MASTSVKKVLLTFCVLLLTISLTYYSISKLKIAKAEVDSNLIYFVYNDGEKDIIVNDNSLIECDFSDENLEISLDIKLPSGCDIAYFNKIEVYGCQNYEIPFDTGYQEVDTIFLYPTSAGKVDILLTYNYQDPTTSTYDYFNRVISFFIVEKSQPSNVSISNVSLNLDEQNSFEFSIENRNQYYNYFLVYDETKLSVEYDETTEKYNVVVLDEFSGEILVYETYRGNVLNKHTVIVDCDYSSLEKEVELSLQNDGDYTSISVDANYPDGYLVEFVVNGMPILLDGDVLKIKNFNEGNYNLQVNVYDENGNVVKSSALFKYSHGEEVTADEEKQASIDISFTKSTEGSLSVGDEITISSQYYNYSLSKDNVIKWYIDGEIIAETNPNFKKTFTSAKTYSIKVEIFEGENLVLSCQKDLVVKADSAIDMALSFSQTSIVCSTSGSVFTVTALLDQMKLTNYTYSWAIDDTSIAQFFVAPNGSADAVIRPIKEGTCKLIVSVDIGRFTTNIKLFETQIVVIGEVESIKLKTSSQYVKPNEDFIVSVLANDTEGVCNVPMNFQALYGEEELSVIDLGLGKYKFISEKEGVITLKASANGVDTEQTIKCSTLPFEVIVKNVLPFVVIIALIVLVINFVVKKRKSPIDKLQESSLSILDFVKNVLTELDSNPDSAKKKAIAISGYKKVLKQIDSMIALSNIIALESNADATNVLNKLKALKSKLKTTSNVSMNDLTENNHKSVYKKLILLELDKINENVEVIKTTHDDYLKIQTNINDLSKKSKEEKLSREEIKQKRIEEFMSFAQPDDDATDDGSN